MWFSTLFICENGLALFIFHKSTPVQKCIDKADYKRSVYLEDWSSSEYANSLNENKDFLMDPGFPILVNINLSCLKLKQVKMKTSLALALFDCTYSNKPASHFFIVDI